MGEREGERDGVLDGEEETVRRERVERKDKLVKTGEKRDRYRWGRKEERA